MVRPASRMSSAISFGVFCRDAPSTSAIIRSRKLSPGRCVTRTTISSESTRVPPVTAERSPPDSRITGADSPVIADSSTLAIPSITSPSAGITSPAETTTTSPSASGARRDLLERPSGRRRWAVVSARVLRSASACALPRPSAIASAKLAKSDGEPEPDRDQPGEDARVGERDAGDEDAAELDDEHDRVAGHAARVELAEAVGRRPAKDRRLEDGGVARVTGRAAPRSARARGRGST